MCSWHQYTNPVLAVIEIGRRTMWGFFRLENEHLNNSEKHRRVKFIPLYFDAPLEEDDGTKEGHSWTSLVEIAAFILVVLALLVVAVVTRQK